MKEKENSGGCLGFMEKEFDKIIIGAGLYGMYAALYCAEKGEKVLVLEYDEAPFQRATYINQARVHMGYHYPRSLSTAVKSAGYFKRFVDEFGFCIHSPPASHGQIRRSSGHSVRRREFGAKRFRRQSILKRGCATALFLPKNILMMRRC